MFLTNKYVDKTNLMCLITIALFIISVAVVAIFGMFEMTP